MRRLTASKFELALQCVWPWTSGLTWDEVGSKSSQYARKLGHAFHKYAEKVGTVSEQELAKQFDLTPALYRRLSNSVHHWTLWFVQHEEARRGVEVKFAMDPMLGIVSVLDAPGERDYSQAPLEHVTGTADIILYDSRRVADYKTSDYASHPTNNGQMRLLSLMVARHEGWDSIGSDIQVFTEAGHIEHTSEQGPRELDRTESELYQVAKLIRQGHDKPNPSLNACRFCPVRNECLSRVTS